MIGYTRYHNVDDKPIGIEANLDLWVCRRPAYENRDWAIIYFNKEDIIDKSYSFVRIKKGIIIKLDWK